MKKLNISPHNRVRCNSDKAQSRNLFLLWVFCSFLGKFWGNFGERR